mgnify:CR=1 FL=1
MPPKDFQQQIDQLKQIVFSHQHAGFDFTEKLRTQDFNLIAQTSLPAAATSIILDGIPPRIFLRILIEHDAKSGNGNNFLRFNNDSGANYTFIENGNNTARTSRTEIDLIDAANNSLGYLHIIDVVNIYNLVKAVHADSIARITAASTAQTRHRTTGTWVSTTASITRVDLVASASNLPAGTSIRVYGSKD